MRIKPDLVFGSTADVTTYVADSKYKVTADGFGREADYYQLLAYTSALNLPEGLLIYCRHDGSAHPQQIDVPNVGTRLRTWALRLDRTPSHVEQELRGLADHIAARAGAPNAGENALKAAAGHPLGVVTGRDIVGFMARLEPGSPPSQLEPDAGQ